MANIVLSDLLDESSGVPLYKQVFYYIRSMILDKTLVCGDQLHSVRVMADRFNVSVCTMHRAYELLEKEGFVKTIRNKGVYINDITPKFLKQKCYSLLEDTCKEVKAYGLSLEEVQRIITSIYQVGDENVLK